MLGADDVAIKSPAGGGLPPYELDAVLGRRLARRSRPTRGSRCSTSRSSLPETSPPRRRDRPAVRPLRPRGRGHRWAGPARRRVRRGARRARHAGRDPRCRRGPKPGGADLGPGLAAGRSASSRPTSPTATRWSAPRPRSRGVGRSAPARQQRRHRRAAGRARLPRWGRSRRTRSKRFDRVMDVNVKGTLVPCQVVGAAMARAGRGSIVNVSSVYGLLSPVQALYDFRRRGRGDVRQARRLLRLQVRGPQPHALPRDLLGWRRRPREHPHARRGIGTTSPRSSSRRSARASPLGRNARGP